VPRRPRLPLRWRIALGATILTLAAFLAASFVTAALFDRRDLNALKSHLRDRISDVEVLVADGSLPAGLSTGGHETEQVIVVDGQGREISRSRGLRASVANVIARPPVDQQTTATVNGRAIGDPDRGETLVVARTISSPTGPTTIYVLSSVNPNRGAQFLLDHLLQVFAPLAAFSTLLTSFIVRRALAPVEAMRAEVARIEDTDMSERVSVDFGENEISRLGRTLNTMLDRLEQGGVQQRLFAGAASHELRSPLSAIRTELEVGLTYPDHADWPKIAMESLIEVTRLEELSRDLRTLTRTGASASSRERIDLTELVDEEIGRRQPTRRVSYRKQLAAAGVVANLDETVRVIRNLFDNAERHAAKTITVMISASASGATLSVRNDGPPIPAEARERIFDPFMRLDEARAYDDGGSGLGLAIARAIMKSNGGSLAVSDLAEGAEFIAWFPYR
jgi:signal transduction histidine kinase